LVAGDHTSSWATAFCGDHEPTDWWQPYLPPFVGLLGSIIVAAAAFVGVVTNNRTNQRAIRAADVRHREQVEAARADGVADRAADRADKLREEVASILAERWAMVDAASELACAVELYRRVRGHPQASPIEQEAKSNALRLQLVQRDHLNHFIQRTIRAGLLTNDPEIQAVLNELREVLGAAWRAILATLSLKGDPCEEARTFRKGFHSKLSDLESLTRRVATADGATKLR
jgi:hypothetical protein